MNKQNSDKQGNFEKKYIVHLKLSNLENILLAYIKLNSIYIKFYINGHSSTHLYFFRNHVTSKMSINWKKFHVYLIIVRVIFWVF